jgi:transcriptional regulator with XRE-family HTH domain
MKTPGQRGAFGSWLTRARTQRFGTQAEALREYERLAGLRITPSQYAQWESGSRTPRADNPKVARLYDFYGSRPEDEQEEAAEPLGNSAAIVAALDRQTAMLERVLMALTARQPGQPLETPERLREQQAAADEVERRRQRESTPPLADHLGAKEEP